VAKFKQPSLLGEPDTNVGDSTVGAYGPRRKRADPVTPVVEALKAHQAMNDVPPWMPDPNRSSLTPEVVEKIAQNSEADREAVNRTFAPGFAQPVIDAAGVDLVADIDNAIAYVVQGRGVVAIRILNAVRAAIEKGRAS